VVGLPPFKPYTFRAVQQVLGDSFVCCWSCRRYVRLRIAGIADRDTRRTTFSCARCGNEGATTLDDPAKDPALADMKLDPVDNPTRHPRAVSRLLSRKLEEPVWRDTRRERQDRRH
jgi:hypothetical protein